jgi:hypothetical protein
MFIQLLSLFNSFLKAHHRMCITHITAREREFFILTNFIYSVGARGGAGG